MSLNKLGVTVLRGLLSTVLCVTSAAAYPQEAHSPVPATQVSSPPASDSGAGPAPATSIPDARMQRHRTIYRRHPMNDRVKDLAKALDLNETQQAGVKNILERQQAQTREIQLDPRLSGAIRNDRFRALQEQTALRIRALLNDEQKKKYDPLNHSTQGTDSDSYIDQWMKDHQ